MIDSILPLARVTDGEAAINAILQRPGVVVLPARKCYFDGFADDTHTEYANPSIYRTDSVRQAQLISSVWTGRLLDLHYGAYYVGVVMYDTAGEDEGITVSVGARQLGILRAEHNDNRRHLYTFAQKLDFRGSEVIRLVTDPTHGLYRIENIVLLPVLPDQSPNDLVISDAWIELRTGGVRGTGAAVTWLTNRPSLGEVEFACDGVAVRSVCESTAVVNHEVVVDDLPVGRAVSARIVARPAPGTGIPADRTTVAELAPTLPVTPTASDARRHFPLTFGPASDTPSLRPGQVVRWPATWGIPFGPGDLLDPADLRVLERSSREPARAIPAQISVSVRWPDGSVRWALLDFTATLRGGDGSLAVYDIETGFARGAESTDEFPSIAKNVEDRVILTTGPMRLEIPRDRLVVPGYVSLMNPSTDNYELVSEAGDDALILQDANGTEYRGSVETVEIEENGSERAVIRIDARHVAVDGSALFRSVLRIHAYHGQAFVRVFHTFENDNVAEQFTRIQSLELRTRLNGTIDRAIVAGLPVEGTEAVGKLGVTQETDQAYRIHLADAPASPRQDGKLDGTIIAEMSNGSGVVARVRNFWQNYPKALKVNGSTLEFGICPPLEPEMYPPGGPDEDRLYFYLVGGVYRFKHGMARTHELFFAYYRDQVGRGEAEQLAALFEGPPVIRMPPEVYIESGALNAVAAKDRVRLSGYERLVDAALQTLLDERSYWRDYGMLNFGDWFGERRYNWGNLEYDTPSGFLMEYLRGGDAEFFRLGEQAVRHLADVDTCHHAADPLLVGGQYNHCIGHAGDYYPRNYREAAFAHGKIDSDHTWVDGLFLFSLLTGDRRIRESAVGTTRRMGGILLNDFDFLNCRDAGWPLVHLMEGYHATGDRFYLNGARVIVERALERQYPGGGWRRLMLPGHCFCDFPRHYGEAGFMIGVLLEGLKRYHEATGDPRVARAIADGAAFLIRDTWVSELGLFHYTSCPFSVQEVFAHEFEGLAYAYRLTGDPGLADITVKAVRTAFARPPLQFSAERTKQAQLVGAEGIGSVGGSEPLRGAGQEISVLMRWVPRALYDVIGMIPKEVNL